jgi:hypothetical protein
MTDYTPPPWIVFVGESVFDVLPAGRPGSVAVNIANSADADVIAAAPDLFEAALRQEMAELLHLSCEECEGNEIPELCETCFPFYDDARVMRRQAIEKARGRGASPQPEGVPHSGKTP